MPVEQLAEELGSGNVVVLDVREADELAIARLPSALHVPLRELPARIDELPRDRTLAVLCHHGVRSAMAAGLLRSAGLTDVVNVAGGIDAWSLRVDPEVPRY